MAPKDQPAPDTAAAAPPSQAFARWAAEVDGAFPAEAMHRAKRALVDVIACVAPGAVEDATAIVRRVAADWGTGPCTAAGAAVGVPPTVAALVNGTAAHALDFDDNFDPAKAHITAVMAPALLALGEARGLDGPDVLAAYIVGVQIATRVGQGLNPLHRNRGWHATATVGAVGAAAACGRLLRLDASRMRHCLNMSTSFAGGFMSQFGSMTKPLHAGKAAEAGVMCALLAEAGLTAGVETFDGPTGMGRLMVGPDLEAVRAAGAFTSEHGQTLRFDSHAVGEPLAILQYGLKVKRFPTCASTHRALDAVLALRARHGFAADDVARVDVHAPVTHFNNLMYTDPVDGLQAKFSMEFCVAVALRNGGVGLADFTPAAVADATFRALMPRVRRHPADKAESEFPTRVEIALKDGRVLSESVDAPKGRADNPLTDAELWDKLRQCCRGVLPEAATERLAAALDRLDGGGHIGDVMAPLRQIDASRIAAN
ncbi:MAG: MmgE/PrpD family protein [Rhodospirillaceae bacterium]|nr:MmgE/PrpD family protein [Rhodospirillaceae bacterium]